MNEEYKPVTETVKADEIATNTTTPNIVNPINANVAKKSKKGLLLLLVGGLLILGGGSAAAYVAVVLPAKPENIIKQMTVNLFDSKKVTSSRFVGEISALAKGDTPTPVTIGFEGSMNGQGVELQTTIDAIVAKPKISLKMPDKNSIFIKVSGLNGLDKIIGSSEQGAIYAPLINKVNDQWYEVSASLLKSVPGLNGSNLDVANSSLSEADMSKLGEIYKANPFIKNVEKFKDEKVNEKDAYHLKIVFDKDKVVGFVDGVKSAKFKALESIKENDYDQVKTYVNKYDWTKYPIEVWVDKASKNLTKVRYAQDYKNSKVDASFTLKDFNSSDIKIEKPTDSKPILELIGDVSGLVQSPDFALPTNLDINSLETLVQ